MSHFTVFIDASGKSFVFKVVMNPQKSQRNQRGEGRINETETQSKLKLDSSQLYCSI
jgi:hypothetical protein